MVGAPGARIPAIIWYHLFILFEYSQEPRATLIRHNVYDGVAVCMKLISLLARHTRRHVQNYATVAVQTSDVMRSSFPVIRYDNDTE